jgi:hypothetical protein
MHLIGYDIATTTAVVARWAGHTWPLLITIARMMIAPSAVLAATGFVLPLLGRSTVVRYCQLIPLARAVRLVQKAPGPTPLPLPWWKISLHLRLTQRQTYISDRIMTCRDYSDPRFRDSAHRLALNRHASEDDAAAIAEAAMIVAAVELHYAGGRQAPITQPLARPQARTDPTCDLARIARALRSPIVKHIRQQARSERQRMISAPWPASEQTRR